MANQQGTTQATATKEYLTMLIFREVASRQMRIAEMTGARLNTIAAAVRILSSTEYLSHAAVGGIASSPPSTTTQMPRVTSRTTHRPAATCVASGSQRVPG